MKHKHMTGKQRTRAITKLIAKYIQEATRATRGESPLMPLKNVPAHGAVTAPPVCKGRTSKPAGYVEYV